MLRKIEAIIRSDSLEVVKEALLDIGVLGLNVFEVRGHGRQGGVPVSWRGISHTMDLIPKVQINVVLADQDLERTVDAITQAAKTGREGDGIIFISTIDDVVRVRTGERGAQAVTYIIDGPERNQRPPR